ncbi:MAG: alpha/beta hydrolase [Chloroflexota bacterium]
MNRLWMAILLILSAITGIFYWQYRRWLAYHAKRVSADSVIVQTRLGTIEYDIRGAGQTILHFHGGNVGHNGWFMLSHLLEKFQIITPNRPGYLGTPLNENGSPGAQADLMASLLDTLQIERVIVIGVSAGGPAALQFALRHPSKITKLVLLSAITKQTSLTDEQLNSTLGKLVMTRQFQNPAYFLIHQAMTHLPKLTLQDFVRTETTYDMSEGKQYIERIMADTQQIELVQDLADAMIPALPRFEGVMNDLHVQQSLQPIPLEDITVPTLIVHSRYDGDVPYENATHAAQAMPNAKLITVSQFGHLIWLGDGEVTRDFQNQIETFLSDNIS